MFVSGVVLTGDASCVPTLVLITVMSRLSLWFMGVRGGRHFGHIFVSSKYMLHIYIYYIYIYLYILYIYIYILKIYIYRTCLLWFHRILVGLKKLVDC